MALVIDNIYTKGISGRVGDTLLYKHYGHKTVVTAFPKFNNLTPSALQLAQRKKFAMAVLKTRQWLQQKATRQFLLGLKQKWNSLSAYHAGIKYLMTQPTDNELPTTHQAVNRASKNPVPPGTATEAVTHRSTQPTANPATATNSQQEPGHR